jgi:serine/threonine protein kinase
MRGMVAWGVAERFAGWLLDGLIAVGGTAEVWHATGERGAAALKRLHTHLVRNDEARALFASEVQVASTLPPHPGVVRAIDAGAVDDRPWLALELARGATLRELVAPAATREHEAPPGTRLPPGDAVAIVAAAAEAAAHMHREGWVHGDINPANLVVESVDDTRRVVLIDLGVARKTGTGGAVRGTHAYMAPEQVRGQAWTPATDVFALGVVLWELIAETRLFHRGPAWLSMAAVVEHPVGALADARLDAIARAALDKDPMTRLGSAAELAVRLHGWTN